ncbi:MAG: glutamate racemase [Ruminococcaceae bacterium]|nr:glutamate racemase [Oscillospiraceae bacterium]
MIGIFDSGLGGLTAVKELHTLSPGEEIVYFGDTGRVPYGTRSESTIVKYAKQDTAFLLSQGVDAILIACGTVSTTALSTLKQICPVPIIGVVEPAAEAAVRATRNGRIAIIGTSATVRSHAFDREIARLAPNSSTLSVACPLFVPLVENGFTAPDCDITRLTCEHYLAPIRDFGADTLILGCTHYPLIAETIARVLPEVTLISAGAEAARRVVALRGIKPSPSSEIRYYVSDDPTLFTASASLFLGHDLAGQVEKIDIERYGYGIGT